MIGTGKILFRVGRRGLSLFSASSMTNISIAAKMTIMKKLLVFAAVGLLYLLSCGDSFAEQLGDGGIKQRRTQV